MMPRGIKGKPVIICGGCGRKKEHWAFGLCHVCYSRKWRAENKDKVRDTNKLQRPKRDVYTKKFYKKHPEMRQEQRKRYYHRHKDELSIKNKAWRVTNRTYHIAQSLLWRKKNPTKAQENIRRQSQLRRARIKGLETSLTKDDWQSILKSFDYSCAYCQRKDVSLTQDHVLPASQGGGYTFDNIIPACKSCNSIRSDMTIPQFIEYMNRIGKPLQLHPRLKKLLGHK